MVVDDLTKTLPVLKHGEFGRMIEIEDKKELLACCWLLLNETMILGTPFNNVKQIFGKYWGLKLMRPYMYRIPS